MKAVCVKPDRSLQLRDIPEPGAPLPGHVLVRMDASAINQGDKTFLAAPRAAGIAFATRRHDTWGASGSGRVIAIGDGVPARFAGRQVALYWSLRRSPEAIGLWSEQAMVPFETCLILPDHLDMRDYCGSLVNVMTARAFLAECAEVGHRGVIATAGSTATGLAMAALARRSGVPAIFLARSEASRDRLVERGVAHVLAATAPDFEAKLAALAQELGATAVFDGAGGDMVTRIVPHLPNDSTIYAYGFLDGRTPVSLPTLLVMAKNLTLRRFSNFESALVKDPARLTAALQDLEAVIEDPLFRTRIGRTFGYDQIDAAMAFEAVPGEKAVLVP